MEYNLSDDEIMGNEKSFLKRRSNGLMLSDNDIEILKRNGLNYLDYSNLESLIFAISLMLYEEENDELEEQIEKDTTNESVCIIDIKLFKYENEFYLIRFVRKSNDITLYYKYMEIIFSIIENNFVKQTIENKTTRICIFLRFFEGTSL